ncbi:MAG: phosphoribosylformylglycinamidine synthase I [Candidatus Schekmanbacteria bacterium RIFCSPHIGHO2_02_FULL_38_11]|uniref:Phosphoribosylformylglycinamidine synthase subunit PurQ n=1 Tax=Candidatus Schekmanbacteria bacterium RIFCSPLOWO2_12_FULL_38_15 TaxID=1817883 RepID=A0A1F7SIA2_9BACT|nr:MAG: phosphoribosylformylglycinamidine synthase I [Candidatus Schekmanbacteria bacterium GWA2_38_9]OGL50739.1 MAG: phosphoribosylformylglycinamidine synthase I [Candidatus Schekmanbacteria bacterium RIFCSPLOWO2_02_FULL_38_14]OGL53501.1 MAG: phosphoribosylformylglycinamidine synthase I [Candidatus Schekmanbacteria bacterium RIFCSPLOWO2_12_FULL_38_15]OGL54452.1 MAG: phosphoribosylformylglycinamidine synthase I [Candidatus Schekmanbacteria bacterium RIFCSPHIGHO2_02_FULL_38_11]
MKFGIIVFPGSNCDHDCYHVIRHIVKEDAEYIWHKNEKLSNYDCIIVPGGFSYGDYLRTGAIARFSKIMKPVEEFAGRGGFVIGICNGFQILLEAGLLPGAMIKNKTLKFICKHVHVRVEDIDTPFTNSYKKGDVLKIPIAHADGNYFADPETIKILKRDNQIIFRYCNPQGEITEESNPNGSLENIAGICNKKRNVVGMMPHPERASEKVLGSDDGIKIWESIVRLVKDNK